MKEKLIIRNFGPIKDVELELGRFNVLIGEQATGKSTVAKLLAICRYFSYIIADGYFIDENESPFYKGLIDWGVHEALKEDSYIYYECKHYFFTVERKLVTLKSQYRIEEDEVPDEFEDLILSTKLNPVSKEFTSLLAELEKIKPGNGDKISTALLDWPIPTSFFQNDVARVMDNPFYFPAERGLQSIFSLGKSSIQNISDALFNQLANLDRIARTFKNETAIEPLDIIYKNIDGQGYVRKIKEDKFYSLFNGASGYKSTIPVVLLAKYYCEIRKESKTFIIEEPELNLFPNAQQKLIQYLVDKVMNYGNTILIETHSPYVLASLNNLMYAFNVGQKWSSEADSIIQKKYWLNPEDVSAYRLKTDGSCVDILDRELHQIKIEELDEISESISNDWHKLLQIGYGKDR